MKSLIGRPKMHSAGESFVVGSGVLGAVGAGVVSYEALNCFDTDFSVAVRMGIGNGT